MQAICALPAFYMLNAVGRARAGQAEKYRSSELSKTVSSSSPSRVYRVLPSRRNRERPHRPMSSGKQHSTLCARAGEVTSRRSGTDSLDSRPLCSASQPTNLVRGTQQHLVGTHSYSFLSFAASYPGHTARSCSL